MKVFLCGGAGFIGAEISRQLLKLGHEVIIFDAFLDFIGPMHSNYQHYLKKRMEDIKDHNQVKIIKGDVRNAGELSRALKRIKLFSWQLYLLLLFLIKSRKQRLVFFLTA